MRRTITTTRTPILTVNIPLALNLTLNQTINWMLDETLTLNPTLNLTRTLYAKPCDGLAITWSHCSKINHAPPIRHIIAHRLHERYWRWSQTGAWHIFDITFCGLYSYEMPNAYFDMHTHQVSLRNSSVSISRLSHIVSCLWSIM